ncbi:SLT11 [[Candida] subhashii]|uniref:Pre-mRNA-splicing factor SLT11 n=1 Tax=[Candida] subhashii TaxID=561895 RepID=A0A8J5R268_9ASCO|nr:SLT11 [[Candida] subhashii]KAG7664840.1 SLT11 [[Candida] subhashii]
MSTNETFSICNRCLGPDKHLRMMKQDNGAECKQCTRPFTLYRWGNRSAANKLTKTTICITCARAKNCCQACLLDINYGIPTDIRDTALKLAGIEPMSMIKDSANREVKAIMADKLEKSFGKQDERNKAAEEEKDKARKILQKLAERLSGGDDSIPRIESSDPNNTGEASSSSINVSKLTKKLPFGNSLDPTTYPEITSFFIFGFSENLPQYIISKYCSEYGKLKSIIINHDCKCGFIVFEKREAAENFAKSINDNGLNKNKKTAGLLVLEGIPMRICFGKQKPLGKSKSDYKHVSLVVGKVMKQLADKDRHSDKTENKTITKKNPKQQQQQQLDNSAKPSNKNKKEKKVASNNNNQYQSLQADFEI